MGNSHGQLKSSRFEAALHMSIEQSLRSNTTTPQPLFSQLYLDKDVKPDIKSNLPGEDGEPSSAPARRDALSSATSPLALHANPPSTHSRPPSEMSPRPSQSPRLPPPPSSTPSYQSPLQPQVSVPMMIPSARLPQQGLQPHHLAQQRFMMPGQFPSQPPPLVGHARGGPQETHLPQTAGLPHPSGLMPRQASPRPGGGEDGRHPGYGREYLEGAGVMYGTLALAGCQEVGFCQAGADIRLTELSEKQIDVLKGFVLVGTKSPYLPENILVAAVDARFLPDPNTHMALLGFSGNCVGCGEKGFRYFTEFSHHINLKLTTQAKKQKHLKYYIIRNKQNQLVRGPNIPWKECRKTNYSSGGNVYLTSSSPNITVGQASVIVPRQSGTPSATISYHGNQVPTSMQPRTSPSATINHYGPVPPHEPGRGHPGGGAVARPGEAVSPNSQQPLKKRHRFHSVDEERMGHRSDMSPTLPPKRHAPGPPLHPPNFIPPPMSGGVQDTTFIPPGLAEACSTKVVILDCSGNMPIFHGNVIDVIVSPLFRESLKPTQHIPQHMAERLGLLGVQNINFETMVLIMIQYFVQLDDRIPSREELDVALLKARQDTVIKDMAGQHNIPQFTTVAPAQLPLLAKLAVATSSGRVRILVAHSSIAEGLSETLKMLTVTNARHPKPLYVVIVHVSRQRGTEFCIVVVGCHQARALIEARLYVTETFKEISYEIITGKIQLLTNHFSKNSPAGQDIDELLEKFSASLKEEVFMPFGGQLHQRLDGEKAKDVLPIAAEIKDPAESFKLHPLQIATAMKILSQVCAIADSDQMALDLGRFIKVDILIIVPPAPMLYHQTVQRLMHSSLLIDLGLATTSNLETAEQYVMMCDTNKESQSKFDVFLSKVKSNPHTLYVLVQDQAHMDICRFPLGQQHPGGTAHRFVNSHDVLDAPNMLTLQVTSLPYNLQTKKSRIAPHNEICMQTSVPQMPSQPAPETQYFGMSDLCDTLQWSNEIPLMQCDKVYENMVESLLVRYPKLHSMVVRTYLLIRQYSAAMMALAGINEIEEDTTSITYTIIRDLITTPLQSESGHGHMVVLRMPSPQLAILAQDKLLTVRDKIGFQYRLDIIMCCSEQEITLDPYFLKRLQALRGEDSSWKPKTYEDLDGLPCIMIMTNKATAGETLPQSLKAVDLRLVNNGVFDLSSLEQELGLACCYVGVTTMSPIVTITEDSDDEDGDDEDDEEVEGESAMEYEVTPQLVSTDQPTQGENSSVKSEVASSSRSTPKLSIADSTARLATPTKDSTDKERPATPQQGLPNSDTTTTSSSPPAGKSPAKSAPPPTEAVGVVTSSVPMATEQSITPSEGESEKKESGENREVNDQEIEDAKPTEVKGHKAPLILLSGSVFQILKAEIDKGHPSIGTLLPSHDTMWSSSLRSQLTTNDGEAKSVYYHQWTEPKAHHYDYERTAEVQTTYHPRRLLLYGPPQIGKTGTYIHFARVLSRMLIRLQEVEVIDEDDLAIELPSIDPALPVDASPKWPEFEVISKMNFDLVLREGMFHSHSPIWTGSPQSTGLSPTTAADEDVKKPPPTTSMRLTKFSSHNAFHHCDQCQNYKDVSAVEARETKAYSIRLASSHMGEDLELQFIIPPQQEKHFVFNQRTGQLMSMVLPVRGEQGPNVVKTPIFMPTFGRHEHGLVNLYHTMEGSKHLHILVCKQKDALAYEKQWPNHIILVLPALVNGGGLGAAKYFIKELAFHNLELERKRQEELGVQRQEVWPYVVIMEDCCVTWQEHIPGKDEDGRGTVVSLKSVIEQIEAIPKLFHYAVLGLRQWCGSSKLNIAKQPFSCTHMYNMVFVNVDMTQNVQYDHNRFFNEDIDFNMRVNSSGFPVCRFNCFSIMKKYINVGDPTQVTPQPKNELKYHAKDAVTARNYVGTPDSEELIPLIAPPQFLLEGFLQEMSKEKLFPLALDNPSNPVLLVDCYLNLGPRITVHFVSSRPHSIQDSVEGVKFSGLLLYMCDAFVEAAFLKQFRFIHGAKLCLISSDRNSLRRQVMRLDLEDQWRFRLRDEFQTANSLDDHPLFLLTGTHDE